MSATASESRPTRARILDAALACFLEAGYEQTTIARIPMRISCTRAACSTWIHPAAHS
jgi:hypothetical protein